MLKWQVGILCHFLDSLVIQWRFVNRVQKQMNAFLEVWHHNPNTWQSVVACVATVWQQTFAYFYVTTYMLKNVQNWFCLFLCSTGFHRAHSHWFNKDLWWKRTGGNKSLPTYCMDNWFLPLSWRPHPPHLKSQ